MIAAVCPFCEAMNTGVLPSKDAAARAAVVPAVHRGELHLAAGLGTGAGLRGYSLQLSLAENRFETSCHPLTTHKPARTMKRVKHLLRTVRDREKWRCSVT